MRNMTIFGRACITKTLALSKVWYVGTVLIPPKEFVDKIEKEITSFLWRGKHHLVNRDIIRLPQGEGGLGVPCVEEKCKALKVKWLKKISDSRGQGEYDWVEMGNHFLMNFSPQVKDLGMLTLQNYNRGRDDSAVYQLFTVT